MIIHGAEGEMHVKIEKKPKLVIGGLGDILMSLGNMKKEGRAIVLTHFLGVKDLLAPFNINASIGLYKTIEEIQKNYSLINGLEFFEKELYPNIDVPLLAEQVAQRTVAHRMAKGKFKKVVGIHPIGSNLANQYWSSRGKPLKFMPEEFLIKIIDKKNLYLIFGSEQDILMYPNLKGDNIYFANFPNIWDSLAFVEHCDYVIGVDSSIKSFAACRKVKSLVLVGDYEDELRDKVFIGPYVEDRVMDVIKFKELDDKIIKEVKAWEKLNNS